MQYEADGTVEDRATADPDAAERLLDLLAVLSSPPRIQILGELWQSRGQIHVSELARRVELSRPLTHMHLKRLEAAGLVEGHLELSAEGRALRLYEVLPFSVQLTPQVMARVAESLSSEANDQNATEKET